MSNEQVEIAIIGGTGVYDPGLLENAKRIKVYTPFGSTSDLITIADYAGVKIAFLPRHGDDHHIPPHHVPYRANLWALKELGIKRVIAPRAVGSLREHMKPRDIVITDQFMDATKSRPATYYDGGEVGHVSMAEPMCSELRSLANRAAGNLGISFHKSGTSVCIHGPRYSTKAESIFYRDAMNADVIGMTLVPECTLARELELCYVSLEMVTDYDAWSNEVVDTAGVKEIMRDNVQTIRKLLIELLPMIPTARDDCTCPTALKNAMI
ncbi:MAG: S-methyl-5'-thioadenosine phosphorylase [Gammaproteobacteria bacterium]|nr:S-methyl-5'-thioadenosine phosphorylase [Gammaproteobacteria bacterium]